jgi:hypothetical protein
MAGRPKRAGYVRPCVRERIRLGPRTAVSEHLATSIGKPRRYRARHRSRSAGTPGCRGESGGRTLSGGEQRPPERRVPARTVVIASPSDFVLVADDRRHGLGFHSRVPRAWRGARLRQSTSSCELDSGDEPDADVAADPHPTDSVTFDGGRPHSSGRVRFDDVGIGIDDRSANHDNRPAHHDHCTADDDRSTDHDNRPAHHDQCTADDDRSTDHYRSTPHDARTNRADGHNHRPRERLPVRP